MDDSLRTTHLQPTRAEAAPEPTISGLVYLFASELVPPITGRATRGRVNVPCRGDLTVSQQPLANVLFATAFWSLRDQGYIILDMGKSMRLRVDFTGREQPEYRGLEAAIMTSLTASGRMDAASTIYNCWKEDRINPWNDVVQVVAEEVSGMSRDCEKRATLAADFDDVARRWQRFQTVEPVLYKALLDECVRGIAARKQGGSVGKGKSTDQDSRVDLGEVLVAGGALGVGMAVADTDGSSGADTAGVSRGFFDFLGDFFGGLGDFVGDFFDGAGDFFGGDSDGGFDFD